MGVVGAIHFLGLSLVAPAFGALVAPTPWATRRASDAVPYARPPPCRRAPRSCSLQLEEMPDFGGALDTDAIERALASQEGRCLGGVPALPPLKAPC